jgi:hypothetical protein
MGSCKSNNHAITATTENMSPCTTLVNQKIVGSMSCALKNKYYKTVYNMLFTLYKLLLLT